MDKDKKIEEAMAVVDANRPKAAHTPGPWGLSSESPRIIKQFDIIGETHVLICSAMGGETSGPYFPEKKEEVEANARLIAAAPDLLEACRLFEMYDSSDPEDSVVMMLAYAAALQAAKAAITRATGAA